MTLVDRDTWRDTERLDITEGVIKRRSEALRHSADLTVVDYHEEGEKLIRVWLEASQKESSSHPPLFTGYATSPERNIKGKHITHKLQCYSVLKPADIKLPRGWYAPAGVNVIWQIKELLKVTGAPIEVTAESGGLNLSGAIVAEQNETNISMVEELLNAINWRMRIDGWGRIILSPQDDEPVAVFDARDNDIVEPEVTDNDDWYSCPNVFRAFMDDTYAEARDEDPASKFSIQRRGRIVDAEETSCKLQAKETLAEYARRRLRELQHVGRKVTYDRRFVPDITVTDVVRLNYPAQQLTGSFRITDQSIALGTGCRTSEEVVQI